MCRRFFYGCPGSCDKRTDTPAEVVPSWENTNCSRRRLGDLGHCIHPVRLISRCSEHSPDCLSAALLNHPHRANVSQFAFPHDVPPLRWGILPYDDLQGIPYSTNIRPSEVYRKSEVESSSQAEPQPSLLWGWECIGCEGDWRGSREIVGERWKERIGVIIWLYKKGATDRWLALI